MAVLRAGSGVGVALALVVLSFGRGVYARASLHTVVFCIKNAPGVLSRARCMFAYRVLLLAHAFERRR